MKNSVKATYDSRETGPAYHVTTRINDTTLTFRQPVDDPFVRQTVRIHWWDALKALIVDRRLTVEVIVGASSEVMNDVLELDENTLIAGRTRKAAFGQSVNAKLAELT